jgi:hypothetical protein
MILVLVMETEALEICKLSQNFSVNHSWLTNYVARLEENALAFISLHLRSG